MGSRTPIVLLLAGVVAAAAIVFGNAYAASGHVEKTGEAERGAAGHESMTGEEGTGHEEEGSTAHMEEQEGAAHAEDEESGSPFAKVVTAILISAAGAALVPIAFVRRGQARTGGLEGEPSARGDARFGLLASLAALSIGAAIIHCVVVVEHWREHWSYGAFFCVSAIAQLVWAVWVLLAPSRIILLLGALGNAAIVLMWVISRTVGIPLGPEAGEREAVAFADTVATMFEILLVIGALHAARSAARPLGGPLLARPAASWVAMLAVAALTATSLLTLVQL
jgi:hypothetical protein